MLICIYIYKYIYVNTNVYIYVYNYIYVFIVCKYIRPRAIEPEWECLSSFVLSPGTLGYLGQDPGYLQTPASTPRLQIFNDFLTSSWLSLIHISEPTRPY